MVKEPSLGVLKRISQARMTAKSSCQHVFTNCVCFLRKPTKTNSQKRRATKVPGKFQSSLWPRPMDSDFENGRGDPSLHWLHPQHPLLPMAIAASLRRDPSSHSPEGCAARVALGCRVHPPHSFPGNVPGKKHRRILSP